MIRGGGGLWVVVCSDISMGARVLFVHIVGASLGREVQMFWQGVGIPVGI